MNLNLSIESAKNCAWRAVYFSRRAKNIDFAGNDWGVSRHRFFHIGIDPTNNNAKRGPCVFGGIVSPWNRRGWSASWRFGLPYMRWSHKAGPIRRLLCNAQAKFWHSLDGRNKTKAARA